MSGVRSLLVVFAVWICVPSAGFAASAVTAESLASSGENTTGAFPVASLTLGIDGNYYGVAEQGGRFHVGTVFRLAPNGDFTVLAEFDGKESGGRPRAHLLANSDGSFHGTTSDPATVFRIAPDGTLATVFRFPPGQRCETALIRASDGNFYGTTDRTVFRTTPQGVITQLTSFPDVSPIQPPNYHITLPAQPSELMQASDGNLYGRTINSVFRITLAGQVTTLSSLGPPQIEGPTVLSPLVEGADGNFYGVSPRKPDTGGSSSTPEIQQITPDGVVTTFASLGYTRFGLTYMSGLLLDADGNFYGTTFAGGAESLGSVFRVSPSGTLTTLFSFDRTSGMFPAGALIKGADGEFFGTTLGGNGQNPRVGPGPNTFGTLYRVTHGGQVATLYSFPRTVGHFHFNSGPLFQAPDQSFYASDQNEYDGLGSIVRIRPNAAAEIVATDDALDNIFSTLVLGPDGNYYGTTDHGGSNNKGSIIRLSPGGALETLSSFDGMNGDKPRSALLLAADGNFYGTTFYGGAANAGTVFRITTAGAPQTVVTFDGTNGGYPSTPLIQATDGAFYGTTGITLADAGTIFRLTPQGALSTLVRFDGTNGQDPQNPLVQASDGNFYGSTNGGAQGNTLFRMDSNGVLSTLVNLGSFEGPSGGLVEGIDGNFYGTGSGGVFRFFPNGAYSLILEGFFRHGLIKGADGAFYGTSGGFQSDVFRLSLSAQITGVVVAGSQVVISGQNLHGATEVSVGGVQATSFVVDSPTQITAIFGQNDPPGIISVTAPLGMATFNPHPSIAALLLNISTRGLVTSPDDGALIGGFIIQGTAPKTVLIRAIGPTLDPRPIFSVALQDPTLALHDAHGLLAFNDNWKDSQEEAINATGIPPSSPYESAIVTTLAPGPYTAIVRGTTAEARGRALVEVYDLSAAAPAVLANISTRGTVYSGDDVLIGGFIVGGDGESSTIVVRALGPSLPVTGALQDPTLEFHDSNGNVFSNNNWRDAQESEIIGTSLQPTDDRESVILATLGPDSYTAIVRGAGGSIGTGLVEIYSLR